MKPFALVRARDAADAAAALAAGGAVLKAGGTDLLDRLKGGLDAPERVATLAFATGATEVVALPDGGTRLGARATLQALAESALVAERHPALGRAAASAASPQVRRRATLGGNLAQHTRCGYYRLSTFPCVKRGAEACPVRAPTGVQENAGLFGNDLCASAHPSSLAPVLGALDAVVEVLGPRGARAVPFEALWAAPARGRASDLALAADELIVAVLLPAPTGGSAGYEEVRTKAAFDWALASAAVGLTTEGGRVKSARVWLGSVAPVPWRARASEALLTGAAAVTEALAEKAGEAAVQGATPLVGNAYKLQLVRTVVRRAVLGAAGRRG